MPHRLTVTSVSFLVFAALLAGIAHVAAQAGPALTGKVTAGQDALEGVLVSAKKSGSTVTVTVVSDKDGRYSFPAARLEPGQYSLRIRAAGYDLDNSASVAVAADKTATADLTLRKTQDLSLPMPSGSPACRAPMPRRGNCSIVSAATRWSARCARNTAPMTL